jgi:DHA3 family macrolide efflux protein-like MFS transporter
MMPKTNHAQPSWVIPFFTLWTGQALSQLGSRAAGFALVWWLTKTTGSATVLATVSLVAFLPQVIFGPIAGALIDRWNRRLVMIVADTIVALSTAWLALQFWAGSVQIWQVYLVTFVGALGGMAQFTAMMATTTLMVPDKNLARVQGANQTLLGLLNITGPPLGALLLSLLPLHLIMGIDVVTAAFAIAPLFFIAIPQPPKTITPAESAQTSVWMDIKIGMSYIWNWPGLRHILIAGAILNLVANPTMALMPLLVTDHFGGDALQLSSLEASFGVGIVIGGLLLGFWGGFRRRILTSLTGIIGMGLGLLIVGVVPAQVFWLALAGMFIMGAGNALGNGALIALLQASVAPEMQGRVFAVLASGLQAMTLIGFAFAGPLTDLIGVQTWFIASGVCFILLTIKMFLTPAIMRMEGQQQLGQTSEGTEVSGVVAP